MGEFFVYIVKSSFCLTLFYLFYKLFFVRETFHRFNRRGLLLLVILSAVIPCVELPVDEPVIVRQSLLDLENMFLMSAMTGTEEAAATTPSWITLLLWGYLSGSILTGVLFLSSCLCTLRIIRGGEIGERMKGGIRLVVTPHQVAPFSWMNRIVISRKDMEEEGGTEILTHETAHIRLRHSADLLIMEVCILFHWFNPAIWLLKRELQHIHEYEADERVIQSGIDAKKYQLLLIKKAVGAQRFLSMANSFNHRSLKKRIMMMVKRKSNPWARLKYAFVLPLAAFAIAAFARPEVTNELEKISGIGISEVMPAPSDTLRVIGTGTVKRDSLSGIIPVLVNNLTQKKPTELFLQQYQPNGKHALPAPESERKSRHLYLVDGKEVESLDNIVSDMIESISVLKDETAVRHYGEKAKNGVIIITTKKENDEIRIIDSKSKKK